MYNIVYGKVHKNSKLSNMLTRTLRCMEAIAARLALVSVSSSPPPPPPPCLSHVQVQPCCTLRCTPLKLLLHVDQPTSIYAGVRICVSLTLCTLVMRVDRFLAVIGDDYANVLLENASAR